KEDRRLVGAYQAASSEIEERPEREAEVRALILRFERGDEEAAGLFREAVARVMTGIRQTLERVNVRHDNVKFESEVVLSGAVQKVLERLRKLEAVNDEDGALYLDLAQLGVATEKPRMFLMRSDGTTLYGTRDIAYHLDKFSRADRLVNVLGEDHKLAMVELTAALRALGEERPLDIVFYNFVSLPEGKMSTRAGRVVYLDDLLDEAVERAYAEVRDRRGGELGEEQMREVARAVGIGALRFNLVGVQPEKAIVFKWEEALAFDGATAPFVQYSHARSCSILRKAEIVPGHAPEPEAALLAHPSEQVLLRRLALLPGLVADAARQRKAHPLTGYAVEVAGALNDFYRDCPVLRAGSSELRAARLALVDATRQVLANTLDLLGVEAPQTM
ncbi:MAG: arginine--tRNA ligase, partial [bacterium]